MVFPFLPTNLFNSLSVGYADPIDFDQLPVPFLCIATNMVTGEADILDKGVFSKSLRASMAIPILFDPVKINNTLYADGGLLNNIPADTCKMMGADFVVSVDVNPTRCGGTEETGSFHVIKASLSIMMSNSSTKGYMFSDVLVKVDTSKFKSYSKDGYEEMYALGYEAGKNAIKEIVNKLYF